MNRLKTQRDAVLDALLDGDVLDAKKAQERFGCYRLAARIRELREAGYLILSLREPGSDGFASYVLIEEGGGA